MSNSQLVGWAVVDEKGRILNFRDDMAAAVESAKDDLVVYDREDGCWKPAPQGVKRRVVRMVEPKP